MSKLLIQFNADQEKKMPDVRPGDTIKVHQKIKEGGKERIQIFEGIVIGRKHGQGISSTITVRKVVEGTGVERVFPVHAPMIEKIEIVKRAAVRRAKLYFLRTAKGKKAKLKRKDFVAAIADEPAPMQEETAPAAAVENKVEEKPAE
jgi:large subunit ribosomal protein L19